VADLQRFVANVQLSGAIVEPYKRNTFQTNVLRFKTKFFNNKKKPCTPNPLGLGWNIKKPQPQPFPTGEGSKKSPPLGDLGGLTQPNGNAVGEK